MRGSVGQQASPDRMLRFVATLIRHRYPRSVPAIAAEAQVSNATAYRYIAAIERLGVFPLKRADDPCGPMVRGRFGRGFTPRLVGIDWQRFKAMV